jgi:hypothetical protein
MDANKQRNWTIIGIIAFLVVMIVVWLFSNVIGHNKVTYTLKVSPMDSTVTLDGKPIKAGQITVTKGTHELSGTRQYFTKATKQINTDNDLPDSTIFLILGADTPEAKQYIEDHVEEQTIREGASDTDVTKLNDVLHAKYPYITQLPHQTLDYSVDYHTNADKTITLDVTLNPVTNPADADSYKQELEDYKQEAIDYMKSVGVDLEKTKVTYDPDPARL